MVALIAMFMVLLSAYCVIFPQKLSRAMPHLVNSARAKYSDIAIRACLGISLVQSAEMAIIPIAFTIFGYISLVAVILIVILGSSKP